MNRRPEPLQTIQTLIQDRYPSANVIFWAGSVAQQKGTEASDLDLVIVYHSLPNAYREAFIYDGWPIDAFVNDLTSLHRFFEESRTGNGIAGLISMILNSIEVTEPNAVSESVIAMAQGYFQAGPIAWSQDQIDKERFLITDVFDDIKNSASREEQIASATWLYEALSQFYFRSKTQWCASGKSIVRYLEQADPELALDFTRSFNQLFEVREIQPLENLIERILKPFGGFLWDGFKSQEPAK